MLAKLQNLFLKLIDRVENDPTPLSRYFQVFGAILALRLTLEFFSSNRLFAFADIIHIGLWFLMIVLAFLLQLQAFSGVKMTQVIKLVVVSFTIALTAPVIDLLISGGHGAKMNYLVVNSWADFWWNYATAGGSSITRGATLGIRIEIALLVFASFNYIRVRSGSYLRAILGSLSIYSVLVLSGIVPVAIGFIVNFSHLTYGENDHSTSLLLFSIDLALLLIAFFRYSKVKMGQLFRQIPWMALFLAVFPIFIGISLAFKLYPANWTMNPTRIFDFVLFPALSLCLATLAGNQINALKTKQKPENDRRIRNGLLLLILLLSFAISERTILTAALLWGLLFFLFEAPFKLYHLPLLRNLFLSMLFVAIALFSFVAFGGIMVGFPKDILLVLLGFGFVLSLIGELENAEKSKSRLLPFSNQFVLKLGFALLILFAPSLLAFMFRNDPLDLLWLFLLCIPAAFHFYLRPDRPIFAYLLFGLPLAFFAYWIAI